jgi:hypothetical protein
MRLSDNEARATLESTGQTSTVPMSGANAETGLLFWAGGRFAEKS